MSKIIQKILFVLRFRYLNKFISFFRTFVLRLKGMHIGVGTNMSKVYTTWPHKVALGSNCRLEHNIYFHYDGVWSDGASIIIGNNNFIGFGCEFNITDKIIIGNDCLIAAGSKFIDHDHGINLNELMRTQNSTDKEIIVGNNVWIGANVTILKGVNISNGAIIAAGAVLNKSVAENEIWGGVPAKKIGQRK